MNRRLIVVLLWLSALGWYLSASTARGMDVASPAGGLDRPVSIAANREGDLYVGFLADESIPIVRRLSPEGRVLARWESSLPASGGGTIAPDLAEAVDGGVFVAHARAERVHDRSPDGTLRTEWGVGGLLPAIASGALGRSLRSSVHVLVEQEDGSRHVRRLGSDGSKIAEWPVHPSAIDLTVRDSAPGRLEQTVLVA